MGWDVWKPKNQKRPEGKWRQYAKNVEIAGLRYHADEVIDFMDGVLKADREGLPWAIELQRDPDNPHSKHGRALKIVGRWTERIERFKLFRPNEITDIKQEEHLGFVPSDSTDRLAKALGSLYHTIPLAAEISEMVIAEDAGESRKGLGVIIRIHVLAPPKKNPIWQEVEQARAK